MSNELASLEADVKEYKLQLEAVQSGLLADPTNAELQNLQSELEEVITLTETALAELKPASVTASKSQKGSKPAYGSKTASPPPEKWSKANHPAYQAGYRPPGEPSSPHPDDDAGNKNVKFEVNDAVLAKWKSGDRGFYPARITSITGSSTNPVYIVTFKSYATTETLQGHEIKPLSSQQQQREGQQKRKADDPVAGKQAGGVISRSANVDAELVSQSKKEPSKVSDGPARPAKIPRKVKANKELEAGKSKWQQFSTGAGKKTKGHMPGKKDSMFRTGEGVHARVGFTGSGQEMRKDEKRSRHIYERNGEDEY